MNCEFTCQSGKIDSMGGIFPGKFLFRTNEIVIGTNIVSLPYNYIIIVSGCSTTKGNGGVTNKKNVK
jgi:hypothetical protein